jgi:hypothetical protein
VVMVRCSGGCNFYLNHNSGDHKSVRLLFYMDVSFLIVDRVRRFMSC